MTPALVQWVMGEAASENGDSQVSPKDSSSGDLRVGLGLWDWEGSLGCDARSQGL